MHIIPTDLYIGFSTRYNSDKNLYKLGYIVEHGTTVGHIKSIASVDKWSKETSIGTVLEGIMQSNKPLNGFAVSNIVFRRSGWGDDKTIWQITDPRGFDFQISSNNMANILSTCTIINGIIQENCVIGISNKNVVLLPVNSEPYLEAIGATDIRNKPLIPMSELKKGDIVRLKRGITIIYFGCYHYIGVKNSYRSAGIVCGEKKYHFYIEYDEEKCEIKADCYTQSIHNILDGYEIIGNVDIPIKLDGYVGNNSRVLAISDKRIKISHFEILQSDSEVKETAIKENKFPYGNFFKSKNKLYQYTVYGFADVNINGVDMEMYHSYHTVFGFNEVDFVDIFIHTLCGLTIRI